MVKRTIQVRLPRRSVVPARCTREATDRSTSSTSIRRKTCGFRGDAGTDSGERHQSWGARSAAPALAAFVDEGDDEDVVVAQVVDDAPGVGGYLAQPRIVELRHLATDARRLGERRGFTTDLVRDALGVLAGIFGDVVVDALRSARARSVQITIRASPLLDLVCELLARDPAAGFDVLHALADLVEYVEPIDDLIHRHVVGELLDHLDGVLLVSVGVHGCSPITSIARLGLYLPALTHPPLDKCIGDWAVQVLGS